VVAPGLVLAACCLFMRDPRQQRVASARPKLRIADALTIFRIPSYVLNTAAMTAMTVAIGGIAFWLPRYLYTDRAADFGGTPDLGQINLIFGGITVAAGLSATLIGGCFDGRNQVEISGCLLNQRFPKSQDLGCSAGGQSCARMSKRTLISTIVAGLILPALQPFASAALSPRRPPDRVQHLPPFSEPGHCA
jgi:hypothetical protein